MKSSNLKSIVCASPALALSISTAIHADTFVLNVSTGTFNGSATGTINGVPVKVVNTQGNVSLWVGGDLILHSDDILRGQGSGHPSRLKVFGNVNLEDGAQIDFSAYGNIHGPAGGTGGLGSPGGPGAEATNPVPNIGGLGGTAGGGGFACVFGTGGGGGWRGVGISYGALDAPSFSTATTPGGNGAFSSSNGGDGQEILLPELPGPNGISSWGGEWGAGGLAGSVGGGNGTNGSNGSAGADGDQGYTGRMGASGARGYNGPELLNPTGGGGGAGGSGGGGGTSGDVGEGGGGGGGGGICFPPALGNPGGAGGAGGFGGWGGDGGTGGTGGNGGGGGGVLQVEAHGRIHGAGSFLVKGGDGAPGGLGSLGVQYLFYPGEPGELADTANGGGNGGKGGNGGRGGIGGKGGTGGQGGGGGGGAAGTVKFNASVINAPNTKFELTGGASPGGPFPGQFGRLILCHNLSTPPVVGASTPSVTPLVHNVSPLLGVNPYIQPSTNTSHIPDLVLGADLFGLTGLTPSDVPGLLANAPPNAIAALMRMSVGPAGFSDDYVGFDMMLYVNLSGRTLHSPQCAFGAQNFTLPLQKRGSLASYHNQTPTVLTELAPGSVWVTLVRSNATKFNLGAEGELVYAPTLAPGNAMYMLGEVQVCPADISGDELINVVDLLLVISNWGAGAGNVADINGDGMVNVSDLLAVVAAWGSCL